MGKQGQHMATKNDCLTQITKQLQKDDQSWPCHSSSLTRCSLSLKIRHCTIIKIIIIIMNSMVKMKIMTMMIMMDRGLCRAGLNFPARDRLKWVRGGLMPHPDTIPRSSSSSEWPYSSVVFFYILYFFLLLCLCDHSIPFEIRGRTMASAFISPLQPGLEPRPAVTKPQPFLPTLMMMMAMMVWQRW